MIYVLIVWIAVNNGVATTRVGEYSTKQACESAGEVWKDGGIFASRNYKCIPLEKR